MARGTKIHSTIKERSEAAARETSKLRTQISSIEAQVAELEKQRNQIFSNCADRIVNDVRAGNVSSTLHQIVAKDVADTEAMLKSLRESLKAASAKLEETDIELNKAKKDYVGAQAALNTLKAAIDQKLKSSPEWIDLNKQIAELNAGAENLKQKIKQAREDRKKKEIAYLTDPYFSYLFKRSYGTENYNPFFLTRLLDGWVASVCNYKAALENFNLLHQLEEYLARSGAGSTAAIRDLEDRKKKLEREAQTDDVKRLENQLSTTARRVQTIESDYAIRSKDVDATKRKIETTEQSKALMKSRDKLIGALRDVSLPTMTQLFGAGIASNLSEVLQEMRRQERALNDVRPTYTDAKSQSDRLAELERKVAYDYKNKEFRSSFDVDDFVTGYMLGTMSVSDLSRNVTYSSSSYDSDSYSSRSSSYGSSSSYSSDNDYSSSRSSSSSSSSDSSFSSGGSFGSSSDSSFSSGGDF